MTNYYTYINKTSVNRIAGLPDGSPFIKAYTPSQQDFAGDSTFYIVGADTGITNTAFSCIQLLKSENSNAVVDFKLENTYYFKEELDRLLYQMDKQIYIANKYVELYGHKRIQSFTFERMTLNTVKDEKLLKGIMDAQATTVYLTTVAYLLQHSYRAVPATAIKKCLTGNGAATKQEMCQSAYSLTGDNRFLYNDHLADAFACAFYSFMQRLIDDCIYYHTPVSEKFAFMTWNFENMPKYLFR